jgi:hypothetical protein
MKLQLTHPHKVSDIPVLMRAALTIFCAIVASVCLASTNDIFVGTFESESRQNFGSDTLGEWRIQVVAPSKGKYVATIHRSGKLIEKRDLIPCSVSSEGYLDDRPSGPAKVICSPAQNGSMSLPEIPFLSYAENGIRVRAIKQKYVAKPDLVAAEGLKPGDSALFETRHHKAKFYARVDWAIYGFRKVSP